nr:MAG TPA: hypothetical protein [Caudoviricetes sp.]
MNNIYSLYKRIMKHDPKAIDDIQTLDEAKEIIKMLASRVVYFNNEMYEELYEKLQEVR